MVAVIVMMMITTALMMMMLLKLLMLLLLLLGMITIEMIEMMRCGASEAVVVAAPVVKPTAAAMRA